MIFSSHSFCLNFYLIYNGFISFCGASFHLAHFSWQPTHINLPVCSTIWEKHVIHIILHRHPTYKHCICNTTNMNITSQVVKLRRNQGRMKERSLQQNALYLRIYTYINNKQKKKLKMCLYFVAFFIYRHHFISPLTLLHHHHHHHLSSAVQLNFTPLYISVSVNVYCTYMNIFTYIFLIWSWLEFYLDLI